ncbi:MAG: glycosyl hydrolase [bacterium]
MRKQAIFFTLAAMMISVIAFGAARAAAATTGGKAPAFEVNFKMPPAQYGSAPFWSWNERLEKNEMIRQMDELKKGGMGGFFIHARVGLITPYLEKEWMDGVKLSVEYAKKIGMLAYLYDEDRWPSGYGSGVVPRQNQNFRQKGLYRFESETPLTGADIKPDWKLIRVFAVAKLGETLGAYEDVTPKSGFDVDAKYKGKTLLYFFKIWEKKTEWFNNESYVDTMEPKAIDAFIKSTYEPYKKAVGDEFGKTVPAIFTDEPCFLMYNDYPKHTLPWTDAMFATFKKQHGYDIESKLPLLYYAAPNSKDQMKVRLDFWTTATEMFREAFGHQIYDWADKNNIEFTGHYMCEDNLVSQIKWIGAAMPMYEYMQMPGIDHLGRNIADVLTAKQASSAAHQFGRPLVLSELYGCAGWNLSLENMKWIADWHYALGINFMNQHLAWYSMRGCRKHDYPCSISYHSPWWRYHKVFGDYLLRATYFTAQGEYSADTLLLHPITSAWAIYASTNEGPAQILNGEFTSLLELMSARQIDYDLGDELIIARHGKVDGGKFIVDKMAYTSIVIPPGVTLRSTTVDLLNKFIANGGKVITVAPAPTLIDAEKPLVLSGAVAAADNDDAIAKLIPSLPHHIALAATSTGGADTTALYVHQRLINGSEFIFIANTNNEKGIDVTATLPYTGRVQEWNLFTGGDSDFAAAPGAKSTDVKLHFEPSGSVLLSVNPNEKYAAPSDTVKNPENMAPVRSDKIAEPWKIVSRDPNAMTLDYIRYKREGDADWSMPVEYYMVQESLMSKPSGTKFQLRYSFSINTDPKSIKDITFVMEQPYIYELTLNGKQIFYADKGWWRDPSFKTIDIKDYIVEGRNILEASGKFVQPVKPGTMLYVDDGVEVESAYIIGDFAVKPMKGGGYEIVPPVETVKYGNLVGQGFPFFSGSINITQDVDIQAQSGEKVYLEFDGLEAITTKVTVNGNDAGLIAFHPHRVEITPFVKDGANKIELELTDSNRNLLGPLHGFDKNPIHVGPGTFKESMTKKYNFLPFGITNSARIAYYK